MAAQRLKETAETCEGHADFDGAIARYENAADLFQIDESNRYI